MCTQDLVFACSATFPRVQNTAICPQTQIWPLRSVVGVSSASSRILNCLMTHERGYSISLFQYKVSNLSYLQLNTILSIKFAGENYRNNTDGNI